jgi:hypothetical protein
MINWRIPIAMHHGHTLDISAFLTYQFWEKIYYKINEKHLHSKEATGHWVGVSDIVGYEFTYVIWCDTGYKLEHSAVPTTDETKGGFPNLHVHFSKSLDNMTTGEELGGLEDAPSPAPQRSPRTNMPNSRIPKHKTQRMSLKVNAHTPLPSLTSTETLPTPSLPPEQDHQLPVIPHTSK